MACKFQAEVDDQPTMAATSLPLLPLLSFLLLSSSSSSSTGPPSLRPPFSISAQGHKTAVVVSPNAIFSAGFYPVGDNAFSFAVWFTEAAVSPVAWTANRGRPVNGHGSVITFQEDGNLVLTDANGASVWDAEAVGTGASKAELLDTGNLVLRNGSDAVVWESFGSPGDTLLPTQPLTQDVKLVSGCFSLYFDNDNVLRLMYDGPKISSIYWPSPYQNDFQNGRNPYNGSRVAMLDDHGQFLSSDGFTARASDWGAGINRRITLDYDGNLRMYSLNKRSRNWDVTWAVIQKIIDVHGLCGPNGIGEEHASGAICSCPPGYEMTDPDDWNKGCTPEFNITCSKNSTARHSYKFVKIPHTDFYGFDLTDNSSISYKDCRQQCLESCDCVGFSYRLTGEGLCYPKSLLFNGFTSPNFQGHMFLKVPVHVDTSTSMAYQQPCKNGSWKTSQGYSAMYNNDAKSINWSLFYIFSAILGFLELLFVLTGWYYLFYKHNIPKSVEEGYRMISNNFRRFTYRELQEATGNFKEALSRGGSGIVYRGVLDDNRVVAVKKLTNIMHSEEQFWAEMNAIGSINHMNLVKMWGFCSEKTHRLLVFEYVENESLDRYLFGNGSFHRMLSWNQRFKVAVGAARGLAYLHHECFEWVVHCDVKPENILLTRDFDSKIADFGLAKLFKRESLGLNITQMRGTMGYMAPEWALNIPVNAKVDVYSYGVVLLEILTGHRISEYLPVDLSNISRVLVDDESRIYEEVPEHRRQMNMMSFVQDLRQLLAHEEGRLLDIVDVRLNGQFDAHQAKTMIKIAVSCLEEERRRRPTMDEVVKALSACDYQDDYPAEMEW